MPPEPADRALQTNRKACYKARDEWFRCMDENNEEELKCRVYYKAFKDLCPESWTTHFIRKRKYEVYKQKWNEKDSLAMDQNHDERQKPS